MLFKRTAIAKTLSALADKLPSVLPDALADEGNRAIALSALAIPLSKMLTDELFFCWKQTLDELSLRTRQDLLTDIENLVPVIYALGSDAAIASVSRAIQNLHNGGTFAFDIILLCIRWYLCYASIYRNLESDIRPYNGV